MNQNAKKKNQRPSENTFQTAFLYFKANLIHPSQIRLQSLAEDFHIGNFSDFGFAQVFQTDKTHDAAADFFVVAHVFNPFFNEKTGGADGREAASIKRQCGRYRFVGFCPKFCDKREARTQPAATASPCSHTP